jgi:nicotinate-nucleotide--dimethylbenzimidazole phosphoribosyltransferase
MLASHMSREPAARRVMEELGAEPVIQADMALGEGTGALCAFPIIDSAVRMINEMNNFDTAKITKYF